MNRFVILAVVAAVALATAGCVEPPPPPTTTTTTTSTSTTVAPPTGTVDQEYDPASPNLSAGIFACSTAYTPTVDVARGQTFVAGKTGKLDQVELLVGMFGTAAPLDISIQTVTAAGLPSGLEIGSGVLSVGAPVISFKPVVLSQPADVVAGQAYAIVLSESACLEAPPVFGWEWKGTTGDGYPGGAVARSIAGGPWQFETGFDLGFRTWVTE
jgi:hypothetical protein